MCGEPKFVTEPKAKIGLVYNGTMQELITAGSAEGGQMQYALGKDSRTAPSAGWSTAIPKAMDAGTYYVWYKVAGDENHNDSVPKVLNVKINSHSSGPRTGDENNIVLWISLIAGTFVLAGGAIVLFRRRKKTEK